MKYTIEDLKKEIENNDNEAVHSIFDELMEQKVKELEPKFFKKLWRLVKDIDFWYA